MSDGINTFVDCKERSFATISLGKKGMSLAYHDYAMCPYITIVGKNGKPLTCDEIVRAGKCMRRYAI